MEESEKDGIMKTLEETVNENPEQFWKFMEEHFIDQKEVGKKLFSIGARINNHQKVGKKKEGEALKKAVRNMNSARAARIGSILDRHQFDGLLETVNKRYVSDGKKKDGKMTVECFSRNDGKLAFVIEYEPGNPSGCKFK